MLVSACSSPHTTAESPSITGVSREAASASTRILVLDYNTGFNSDQAHAFFPGGSAIYNYLNPRYVVTRVNTFPASISTTTYDQVWVFGEPAVRPATEQAVLAAYLATGGAIMFQSEVGCCNGSASALQTFLRSVTVGGSGIVHATNLAGSGTTTSTVFGCNATVNYTAVRVFEMLPTSVTPVFTVGGAVGTVVVNKNGLIAGTGGVYGSGDYNSWFLNGTQTSGVNGPFIDQVVELLAGASLGANRCTVACGDGTKDVSEACDDGNANPADGCSSVCALEPGFTCAIPGTACASTCGDSIQVATEACDDGNILAGDGCSATCTIESGFTCFAGSANLISNGFFDTGNTGFTSDLTFAATNTAENQYFVTTPSAWRVDLPAGLKDGERSAANQALVFNGGSAATQKIFSSSVTLAANTNYVVQALAADWTIVPVPPKLELRLNGVKTTPIVTVPSVGMAPGTWTRIGSTVRTTAAGTFSFDVVDTETAIGGNDGWIDAVQVYQAAANICAKSCTVDADCPGQWCDTTGVGHAAICRAKLANGTAIPNVPNRAPTDASLAGVCTVASAAAVCVSSRCNTSNVCAPPVPTISAPANGSTVAPNPTISGTGVVGATITVVEGMTTVCTATVMAGGTWGCASTLAAGIHSITATQTTGGATSNPTAVDTFTIVNAPVVSVNTPAVINAANVTAYPVSGTCTTGQGNVTITVGTLPAVSVPCTAGTFSTTVNASSLADAAVVAVTASQTNVAGTSTDTKNTSKDATAPSAPIIVAPANNAEVAANPTISGTGENGATVTVREGATVICTTVVTAGAWSCPSTLMVGPHSITATQTDAAMNTSAATALRPFVVVAAPVVVVNAPALINAANAMSYPVSGTCTVGYPVIVTVGSAAAVTATCTAGTFSTTVNVSGIPDAASVNVTASQNNVAGTGTNTKTTSKDATAPLAPVILAPVAAAEVAANPTISGTAEANSTVIVREGATVVCTAMTNAAGAWSCPTTLMLGAHTVTATATDTAGNIGPASTPRTFTVIAPPTVTVATPAVINAANAMAFPISGTCTNGYPVVITVGVSIGGMPPPSVTTTCTGGMYSTTLNVTSLPDGASVPVSASQTNGAGTGTDSKNTLKDTAAPLAPVILVPAANAEVAANPTLSGTGEIGATVTVREGAATVCTAVVSASGTWTCSTTLMAGPHSVTATQTDTAGNPSVASPARPFVVVVAPVVVITTPVVINAANAMAYPISGTCTTGYPVNLTVGTSIMATATCTAGMFTTNVNVSTLMDGMVSIVATQTNVAGTSTNTKSALKDTVALAPSIVTPANMSTVGQNPMLTGTGEAGATVTVREGMMVVCTAVVSAAGNWNCATTLGLGIHTVIATQVDANGNSSPASMPDTFTVAPLPMVTLANPGIINAANAAVYPVSGTCTSAAGNVTVVVAGVTKSVACTAGMFATTLDLSAVPDVSPVDVTASQTNALGTGTDTKPTSKDTQVGPPNFTSPVNGSTVNANPAITGIAEPGATVVVKEGNTVICTVTANSAGIFTCPSTLTAGTHSLTAIQTDVAGNVSAPANLNFIVGTGLAPVVTLTNVAPVNSANVTMYPVSGTCDSTAGMVTIVIGSVTSTTACTNGMFMTNVNLTNIPDVRPLIVTASQTNAAGTGTDSKSTSKDTIVAPPGITSPAAGSTVAANPELTGTAEPGAAVIVREGMTVVCNATADNTGAWSCNSNLMAGAHSVTATQTDVAGNVSLASPVRMFTIAAVPRVTVNDPANVNSANKMNFPVSGTCDASAGNVTVSVGTVSTMVPCTNGMYSATLNLTPLADGPNVVTASQTNMAGTGTASKPVKIDTVALPPTIVSPAEGSTVPKNPSISGIAEPGAIVTIKEGNTVVCTAVANSLGAYSCNSMLGTGSHMLTATQVDTFGNTSVPSMVRTFIIADVPAVTLNMLMPVTSANASMYPVSGTCDSASGSVTVSVGMVSSMLPCTNGMFMGTIDVSSIPDGMITVTATQTNAVGTGTATQMVSKDATAPNVPVVTAPANNSTSTNTTPTYSGTAEPGSTVSVIVDGMKVGETTADAMGNWSLVSPSALPVGSHTVSASAKDAAGNTSVPSSANAFVVAPADIVPSIDITNPIDGSQSIQGSSVEIFGTTSAKLGDTVEIFVDGVKVGETKVMSRQTFSFTIPSDKLPAGDHTIEARIPGAKDSVKITVNGAQSFYLAGGGCGCNSADGVIPLFGLIALALRRRKSN
jgi:large repetitive protein